MKYSKATNYALHTVVYMAQESLEHPIGVKQLAETQSVSPTYLSKILTKLAKEGIVRSISGVNGGYTLTIHWEELSFLDIIQAIEGKASIFEDCLYQHEDCGIKNVMLMAEEKLEQELREHKIVALVKK